MALRFSQDPSSWFRIVNGEPVDVLVHFSDEEVELPGGARSTWTSEERELFPSSLQVAQNAAENEAHVSSLESVTPSIEQAMLIIAELEQRIEQLEA